MTHSLLTPPQRSKISDTKQVLNTNWPLKPKTRMCAWFGRKVSAPLASFGFFAVHQLLHFPFLIRNSLAEFRGGQGHFLDQAAAFELFLLFLLSVSVLRWLLVGQFSLQLPLFLLFALSLIRGIKLAIQAVLTGTEISALHSRVEALTVLLSAEGLRAFAALLVAEHRIPGLLLCH